MAKSKYCVVDDYGDNWENGPIACKVDTLEEAEEWAEGENFHSASIIILHPGGRRELVR